MIPSARNRLLLQDETVDQSKIPYYQDNISSIRSSTEHRHIGLGTTPTDQLKPGSHLLVRFRVCPRFSAVTRGQWTSQTELAPVMLRCGVQCRITIGEGPLSAKAPNLRRAVTFPLACPSFQYKEIKFEFAAQRNSKSPSPPKQTRFRQDEISLGEKA